MQSYKNHIRYYAPHHFVFYPLLIVLLVISLYQLFSHQEQQMIWIFITALIGLLGWLSFMLRQHYALNNQNRIVRLELRYRYFALTNQRFENLENSISFGQIAALRFASDEELVMLTDRVIKENLSPDEIKKSIVNWQADNMRV